MEIGRLIDESSWIPGSCAISDLMQDIHIKIGIRTAEMRKNLTDIFNGSLFRF
jgi:hypothetical protein